MGILARLLGRTAPPAPARRSFEGAGGGRRGESFRSAGPTGPETLAAGPTLRARARHLVQNQGYVSNGVQALVAEIVGAGLTPTSQAPDPAMRPTLDRAFALWAATADADGRTDLHGLVAEIVRAVVVDGEALLQWIDSVDGLRLRHLPAEFLDHALTREIEGGGYIAAGVEFDAAGQRVAYHLMPARPTDLFPTAYAPIRVPAREIIHVYRPLGAGQVRGVSWLAPVIATAGDFDQLTDAMLVAQKVAALLGVFVIDQSQLGQAPFPDLAGSPADLSLEPGIVRILPPGSDIKTITPQAASEGTAFAKMVLGQIAAGIGVPQHLVDGDLSGANYSSLRAGLLPFRQKVEQFQYHCLIPQLLAPIWRRFLITENLEGRLDLPDLGPSLAVEWLPPRPMQVDPLKDAQAVKALLSLGLTSRRQAAATLGWDVAELDGEIAADRDRESDLGLGFTEKGMTE